jgi:hypothetical protein
VIHVLVAVLVIALVALSVWLLFAADRQDFTDPDHDHDHDE